MHVYSTFQLLMLIFLLLPDGDVQVPVDEVSKQLLPTEQSAFEVPQRQSLPVTLPSVHAKIHIY